METKPPLIELHDAVVRRKGKEILNVGDFTLQQGESIALIGPNGAGKSTFIHLITREVFPLHRDEPPVLFKGKSLVTLEEFIYQLLMWCMAGCLAFLVFPAATT